MAAVVLEIKHRARLQARLYGGRRCVCRLLSTHVDVELDLLDGRGLVLQLAHQVSDVERLPAIVRCDHLPLADEVHNSGLVAGDFLAMLISYLNLFADAKAERRKLVENTN